MKLIVCKVVILLFISLFLSCSDNVKIEGSSRWVINSIEKYEIGQDRYMCLSDNNFHNQSARVVFLDSAGKFIVGDTINFQRCK